MSAAGNWLLATLAAIVIAAACNLDGPDDTQAARDVAAEADYAAALADGGAAKCAAHGRVPLWTADGDLICRGAGPARAVIAQGGQP